MFGVLFTEAETGAMIRCGICNNASEKGFNLEPKNDKERRFLKFIFQDNSNWSINECCLNKFEKECSDHHFKLRLTNNPPENIIDEFFDIGDVPKNLLKEISSENEFYVLKTKNGDLIQGFLLDFNDLSFEMLNCFKKNFATKNWERVGNVGGLGNYWVRIPTDEIISVEKAPYTMKSPDDYGIGSFY